MCRPSDRKFAFGLAKVELVANCALGCANAKVRTIQILKKMYVYTIFVGDCINRLDHRAMMTIIISFPAIYIYFLLFFSLHCLFNVYLFYGYLLFLFLLFHARPHQRQYFLDPLLSSISVLSSPFNYSNFSSTYYLYKNMLRVCTVQVLKMVY